MKKFFLLALTATSLHAQAQTEKGNLMLGTNVGDLSGDFRANVKNFHVGLVPKAGYFVTDKFVLGGGLSLGASFYSYNDGSASRSFTYGLLPYSRYYFGKGKSRLFAEVDFGYLGFQSFYLNQDNKEVSDHTYFYSFSGGPGFTHFITPNVGLEALLKIRREAGDGRPASIQPSLDFGFQIYLNRNKREKTENTQQ